MTVKSLDFCTGIKISIEPMFVIEDGKKESTEYDDIFFKFKRPVSDIYIYIILVISFLVLFNLLLLTPNNWL